MFIVIIFSPCNFIGISQPDLQAQLTYGLAALSQVQPELPQTQVLIIFPSIRQAKEIFLFVKELVVNTPIQVILLNQDPHASPKYNRMYLYLTYVHVRFVYSQ